MRAQSAMALRVMLWIARRLGWHVCAGLLYPITLYFYVTSRQTRIASRDYLARVLGRRPREFHVMRHVFTFACVILDRVFFLTGNSGAYRLDVKGLEALDDILDSGRGCILLGSHMGSFDVLRVFGRDAPVRARPVMFRRKQGPLTSLLEQALSTAQQAQQTTPTAAASTTGSVALTTPTEAAGNLLINVGATSYTVAITASEALSSIESQINAVSGLGANGAVTASDDGSGHLVLTGNTNATAFTVVANAESAALGVTTNATTNNVVVPSSATRTTLQGNFNNILTQIDQLAGDSSYNGVNLLNGDSLKVLFNENGTSSLTISGVNFNSKGLGLSAASGTGFLDNYNITTAEAAINSAITTVRAQTETFGTNSGTISTRQTFEQNMINTLQTGASNLVLADQNQESANLLTLQTRQQLEISALSIANQANQSVLKLFP